MSAGIDQPHLLWICAIAESVKGRWSKKAETLMYVLKTLSSGSWDRQSFFGMKSKGGVLNDCTWSDALVDERGNSIISDRS